MYKFEQLAAYMKQLIKNGTWAAGSKLPSLRTQANSTGLSLMTVLNAYQELEAQGLIYSQEKVGFFVAHQSLNPPLLSHLSHINTQNSIEINSLIFQYLKSIQNQDLTSLGSAFPNEDLLTNLKLRQSIVKHAKNKNSYAMNDHMPPGNLALRKLIASRYSLQGIYTDADDIVITSGALEALNLSLQALTKAGDYILLQQSIFYGAWQAAERLGLKVITLPDSYHTGFDLKSFEQALQDYPIKVCWLMLNSHNPIGYTVSPEIKTQIIKQLHQHQVYLIEDDVYQELYFSGSKPLAMSYFDQQQAQQAHSSHHYVLHCSSFSKVLGSSIRIGWVHARAFSNQIQHLQLMSTITANPLIQHALVDFLASHHYEKHLHQLRLKLKHHKHAFYQILKEKLPPECEIFYYPSSYFLWIKLPYGVNSMDLYHLLIQQHIGVAPSQLFQLDANEQQFIRLNCSFALHPRLIQAIEKIAHMIKQLQISI